MEANRLALGVLGVWLLAAAAFTHLGGQRAFPPPLPQAVLGSLVLLLAAAYALRP
jgi:hypothetical protein